MTATAPAAVALIEDDAELREATAQALSLAGFAVTVFSEAKAALGELTADFEGVVVSDIRMPEIDGLELFAILAERDPELPVVLVTGHGDVAMAVEAMKRGAADFLTKPFPTSALVEAIRRAAATRALVIENRRLRASLRNRATAGLLGTSEAIQRLDRLVSEVARTDLDVHVTGDRGMGKSRLARRIHELSARQDRPFVTIDAGVWTHTDAELLIFGRDRSAGLARSGLIERAQGGTLLLDDVEAISEDLRGRIRALLEKRTVHALGAERARTVDVRILAATGSHPPAAEGGQERRLLDYLGGVIIAIPALADRREDVAVVFRHFLGEFEQEFGSQRPAPTSAEWARLLNHDWPGGWRELRDFARLFALGLNQTAAPASVIESRSNSNLRDLVAAFEKAVIADALKKEKGRITDVQILLSVKRKTLYDKFARYNLNPKDYR